MLKGPLYMQPFQDQKFVPITWIWWRKCRSRKRNGKRISSDDREGKHESLTFWNHVCIFTTRKREECRIICLYFQPKRRQDGVIGAWIQSAIFTSVTLPCNGANEPFYRRFSPGRGEVAIYVHLCLVTFLTPLRIVGIRIDFFKIRISDYLFLSSALGTGCPMPLDWKKSVLAVQGHLCGCQFVVFCLKELGVCARAK